ncbi:hypothetical protein SAMN04487995_4583 [Dyadobacter koreensis]|uniref:Uncharacterized protein n=1 Tax=Dyadobacter koreensis TaxID=408657 RepID=A0A1H6YY83_9BACT|nr:hypothetical protein [Dyadobacter koreensis]SEJ41675.1 hypothetical protein SAMN04487995_4583 [Dyadobacter koreensis]
MAKIDLPITVRGRNISENNIPTVCNIYIMLRKLIASKGDTNYLKNWELRSYHGYNIESIKSRLLTADSETQRIEIIKSHILDNFPNSFGPHFVDIYLVAYLTEFFGPGKSVFMDHLKNWVPNEGSRNAIRQVGLGDGKYLGLLNPDGTVKDWAFFEKFFSSRNNLFK